MKTPLFLIMCFLFVYHLHSQDLPKGHETITQAQYIQSFPIETQMSQFIPTTDYICILPSNEVDTGLQKVINTFYRNSFINYLPTVPNQTSRVISDKQALTEDLSHINIYAFGTVRGNLWTTKFMEKSGDFPIKITDDSIVAEKVYRGRNLILTSLWYNPENYKHSLFLFIPQNLECARDFKKENLFQYSVWQNGKQLPGFHHFTLRNNQWNFSNTHDSLLTFRDVNHAYVNPFKEIDRFHFRYPSSEQLNNCRINAEDIDADTVALTDINDVFSNISDMEWLRSIAHNNKIIEVGESHHLKFNNLLFRRILFAINSYDYYPVLVLELPYSYAAYINYYLKIEDDNQAKIFCDSVLAKISKAGIPTFSAIRIWNKLHKEKTISVGCSDLEQDLAFSINYILNPYFKKAIPEANLTVNRDNIYTYLDSCKGYIERAKTLNIIGEYPFQTPEFMENVFENLKSSVPIKLDPKKFTDHSNRYQVMIRNITDTRFLGKLVTDNKCIFFGGSEHFKILNKGDDKNAIKTEGYYLAHAFNPTMGKVYSICLDTKAVSIEDSIQKIDPNLVFTPETELIRLYKEGKIKLNEPVLGFNFSEFDKFIYKLSYSYPGYALRIQEVDLDAILKKEEGFERFMEYIYFKRLQDYNTNIIIPYSTVGD
jgi:hypothetical protein